MNINSDTKVIIFGAGKIGRRIFDLCQDRGIEVIKVWDNFPDKVVEFHRKDLMIIPPDFTNKDAADYQLEGATIIVTAFSPNMARKMAAPLLNKGFGRVIYDRTEISSILSSHCEWLSANHKFRFDLQDCFICPARRDEKIECNVFNQSIGMVNSDVPEYISFPTLGFLLTTKCNLTCVGCNHLRDHFDKSDNVDFNISEILDDLKKLLVAVDFIKSIVIVGGEALMHPRFEDLLRQVLELPKIGFIQIITNGTVVPKGDAVFKLLANKRVVVEVSGYGNEPGHPRVKKRDLFFKKLSEFGVFYRYDEATQWVDFGGFEERSYKADEWKMIYQNCCFVSNDLFNGQLHKCSRSAYGQFLEKIPNYKDDIVDIRTTKTKDLRKEILRYLETVPAVCRHCNGTTTKTIPAGVQVVKVINKNDVKS